MPSFNKLLLAAVLAYGGYAAWDTYHQKLFPLAPLYPKPYIVVYGRESCGFCQAVKADLDARKIPYRWKLIDENPGREEVFSRMKEARLDTSGFLLPVVDVNDEILVHPDPAEVLAKYRL